MTALDAVKNGDHTELARLLDGVDDINTLDDDGWTLLNWAAGRGDLAAVTLLVARGADVLKRGRDNRTPYLIALAAGHREIVMFLRDAERKQGSRSDRSQGDDLKYCKAYPLARLRSFPEWVEGTDGEDDIAFLHSDYSVTRTALHGQEVIFSSSSEEWRRFCRDTIGFSVPTDLDLLPSPEQSTTEPPREA